MLLTTERINVSSAQSYKLQQEGRVSKHIDLEVIFNTLILSWVLCNLGKLVNFIKPQSLLIKKGLPQKSKEGKNALRGDQCIQWIPKILSVGK